MKKIQTAFFIVLLLGIISLAAAQPVLKKDYSFVMEIPSVVAMGSSPAHMYILSEKEGMAVFRTYKDSLQWLYTSPNMERRGRSITADIRFAYLFGSSSRLTVLEPTSMMGVYSAAMFPARPLDAGRNEQNLFVALGSEGLGKISLQTPAAVDSTLEFLAGPKLSNENIIGLETSSGQLFALSVGQKLFQFSYGNDDLSLMSELSLSEKVTDIYLVEGTLYGTDSNGNIYEIGESGNLSKLGSIGEPVSKIEKWRSWLIIKGKSNRLWTSYQNRSPQLWKKNRDAGNYFTVSGDALWLSEYNHISRIIAENPQLSTAEVSESQQYISGSFSLQNVPDQTVPHSQPLLFPIKLKGKAVGNGVQFSYKSAGIENAEVRGQSFYWRPDYNDIGTHRIKIIASSSGGETDSTSFKIDVRSFNAPPRFAPIRPISIPQGEEFSLPIKAVDPDGMDPNLIRFLGVNLPYGASIDEQTGTFSWTPTMRQTGENQFRVIATDQYGAATSVDITINVIENLRDSSQ